MSTLKERLKNAPDVLTKSVKIEGIGEVTIRKLTVGERDEMIKNRPVGDNVDNIAIGTEISKKIIIIGMVEPTTTEPELLEIPASIVDKIAQEIMDFNGWTDQSRRSLEDQFRSTA